MVDCVKEKGGEVVGVALLVDRSNGTVDFGVKTVAAYTAEAISYEASICLLCEQGAIPPVKPGNRKI